MIVILLCGLTAARTKYFALVIFGIVLAQTVSANDDWKQTSVKPNAETSDGWGLAKATPNHISGVVLGIDGKPASLASVHVKANSTFVHPSKNDQRSSKSPVRVSLN